MKKIMFNDRYGLTKAVIEGRKTMTRRIVPDGTPLGNWEETEKMSHFEFGDVVAVAQAYKDCVNEILVNWKHKTDIATIAFKMLKGWKNKMFVRADLMPHQIRITNVRVERLQEICDNDCRKEGIDYVGGYSESYYFGHGVENIRLGNSYREAFAALIDKVSGKGTWQSNPWVFVYQFELVK